MKYRIKIISLVILVAWGFSSFGLPKYLEKKVGKEIERVFGSENIELKTISLSKDVLKQLPASFNEDNFFKLKQGNAALGYIYVGNAPSKTATFDYLVVFDADLKVIHSKVLVYREEYGGEIGSKRWLRQFNGKSSADRVDHTTNIDGISGATISVRSMTTAMDNLFQSLAILQKKNLLNEL